MNTLARIFSAAALVICSAFLLAFQAHAQAIEVTPSNVLIGPGQSAAAITVSNRGSRKTAIQVRAFAWSEDAGGEDVLAPTGDLMASPPIASIEPGASQVVRLVLQKPARGREETYRILLDQLPPPKEAGVVHVLLRLSIPMFAQPEQRIAARLHWRIANSGGQSWLIVSNDGDRHLTLGAMTIRTADGRQLKVGVNSPPHVLVGSTHRWPIVAKTPLPINEEVRLTANADIGTVDERIRVDAGP